MRGNPPLDSLHDNITDTDDESDFAADVDPDTLIRIVRTELKNGKAPGIDNVFDIILKKAEKTKVIIFSKSQTAIRAEPALSLYGDLLLYYPQIKFPGITFDNRMIFTN